MFSFCGPTVSDIIINAQHLKEVRGLEPAEWVRPRIKEQCLNNSSQFTNLCAGTTEPYESVSTESVNQDCRFTHSSLFSADRDIE